MCRWKDGYVHLPNCKSFIVTQAERKHVRRGARLQQHQNASCYKGFFWQGKTPKENNAILKETLGQCLPKYITCQNIGRPVLHGDFSTCFAPRTGRPKTVTTTEINEKIHKLILEHSRITATSIAEQLGNSGERFESNIHGDLDMQKLSAMWVPKCMNVDQ